jgi:hypothetical protein
MKNRNRGGKAKAHEDEAELIPEEARVIIIDICCF